jgi:peptide/nickel transport system permease protein
MRSILLHYAKLLGSSLLLLLVVITVLFLLLEISPGDPVQALLGEAPVTEEFRRRAVEAFGLDKSPIERYFIYVGNILTGNMGYSVVNQLPVSELIFSRIGNTLMLTLPAIVISTIGAVILGSIAARTRKRWLDGAISGGAVALFSVPNFWVGILLIMLFSITLGWLPAQGMSAYGSSGVTLSHLILPLITLLSGELAFKTRVMRSSMIESLGQDYIDTARSKGLSPRRILWRHGLPNAMLPMVTVIGFSLGYTLAGSVLVERVFSWPGMGLLMVDSIGRKDNAVTLGVVVVITVTILVVNILTDVVYGIVDPRLRARLSPQRKVVTA